MGGEVLGRDEVDEVLLSVFFLDGSRQDSSSNSAGTWSWRCTQLDSKVARERMKCTFSIMSKTTGSAFSSPVDSNYHNAHKVSQLGQYAFNISR